MKADVVYSSAGGVEMMGIRKGGAMGLGVLSVLVFVVAEWR